MAFFVVQLCFDSAHLLRKIPPSSGELRNANGAQANLELLLKLRLTRDANKRRSIKAKQSRGRIVGTCAQLAAAFCCFVARIDARLGAKTRLPASSSSSARAAFCGRINLIEGGRKRAPILNLANCDERIANFKRRRKRKATRQEKSFPARFVRATFERLFAALCLSCQINELTDRREQN